ncbi:MAG: glycosyltransferase, partial [Burkholderiaceae bacterium]
MAVSDFVRSEITEVFGATVEAKTVGVKNGVSAGFAPFTSLQTQSVCQRYGLTHANSDSGFILSVGAQEPRKNLAQLIQAYAQLPEAVKQRFPLILVGPKAWQTEDLEALLTRHRHEPIRWLGYVPQADLPALYAA